MTGLCAAKDLQKGHSLITAALFAVFCICLILFFLTPPALAADPLPKPLKIAYCKYMPFYFEGRNKQPRGIMVDIWERWSAKTGIRVEFILLPWDQIMEKTAAGQIDISALMYQTRERQKQYHFSKPLMNLSTYLYVRKNTGSGMARSNIKKLEDLNTVSVGAVAKDFTRIFLKQNLPGLNPIIFKDHESLVKAALNGNIQAYLMEGPVASTYIAKYNGSEKMTRLENPVYTKPLFAGVKYGNSDLIEKINKGLEQIQPQETQKIVQEWTGNVNPLIFTPRSGKLKIAASIDNMPFHFADEQGVAVGYFVDLWRLWSKKTGIDVEFITAPWAQSLAMVKSGQADIHAGCFFSAQRDAFLDYAGVLSDCETHFFFHESIFGLKNLEDLKGFQIGVLDQDYAVEFVSRELPDAAIKRYGSHEALFEGVSNGEIRVFICDTPTALYFLEKMSLLSAFRYHPAHPLYRKPFYSAVKEGNVVLVKQINKGLEAISLQERAAIERKWMGTSDLAKKDVLVVAIPQSFPPFSMLSAEGKPSGLFIDMWEEWSRQTGKAVAFRMYDRESGVHALKDGVVDVVSYLPPRESIAGWTQTSASFYRLNWYLYQHINIQKNPMDILFSKTRLGAVFGSRAYAWLIRNRPDSRIMAFETTRQMILAAAAGSIDGFLALPQEMAVLPDQLGLPGAFVQSASPLFQQQMAGVVRNFNPDLIALIDQGFEAIEHTDRLKIESRWVKDSGARIFTQENDRVILTRDEKKWLLNYHEFNHPIRLGVNPEWPPFEFIDSGKAYSGMVADYVTLLNRKLGLNMSLTQSLQVSADQVQMGLERLAGSGIDVIPSAISFEPDVSNMLQSDSYLEFPWVIINKQQAPLIGGIRDLYGKTLAVIGRYSVRELLQHRHPQVQILEVSSTREGLDAVLTNRADGYMENLAVAGYQIQAQNYPGLKVAASTDFPGTGLRFNVRKDWPELVGILNKGIASITDREHDQIRQKWFAVRFEHRVDTAYVRGVVFKIAIGVLMIGGLLFFWNWQIRKRKQAAEAANLSKTKFLASLSHEIRTPLNAILGMTEMTLRSAISLQQKKNLTAVKDSALHLLDVMTDILDFSTIEAGKMRIQNQVFDLPELLSSIEHTWKFLAREKGLWFNLVTNDTLPKAVRTDPVRLQQVLGNLISNAVKFTHSGGVNVVIKPEPCRQEEKDHPETLCLLFKVQDTGIGIDRDQQEDIFERFTQAETSMTRNYGGTGLGLSICREAARLMGGTLSLKSSPGKGSRFYLKLPLEVVPDSRLPKPEFMLNAMCVSGAEHSKNRADGLTILLAEDDPMNAGVFKSFLQETDHVIIHARDGEAAIQALEDHEVDMVFMDIEMPIMDGISACRAIRNGASGAGNIDIPIIAMSAHVLEEFKTAGRDAGMNEFIAKPVDVDRLFLTIDRYCGKKGVNDITGKGDLKHGLDRQMDREKALASLGGNEDLLAIILKIFARETPGQITELERALENENLSEITRYAHTLKGAAGRIFARACVRSAKHLETLCRGKNPDMKVVSQDAAQTIKQFRYLIECIDKEPGV